MARQKYNHNRRIEDLQPAKVKSVYPGTIVQFKYKGENVNDDTPLVLILWNDYQGYLIHGINLKVIRYLIKILWY